MKRALLSLCVACALVGACSDSGSKGECSSGEWTCSEDALVLTRCQSGQWQTVECMGELGQLCEQGACVDPWLFGAPVWNRCEADPLATQESLFDKMQNYEDLAQRLHIHPQLKWITQVTLPCAGTDCSTPEPGEDTATWQDVETWHTGENDGLWSAMYLAAEGFRYGTTRDSQALSNIKVLLDGELDRMAITGVPGIFTRQYIPPDVPGIGCPEDLSHYIPDLEKDDNQWVRVSDDGCVEVIDPDDLSWVTTDHCGLSDYAGWCWLDNVSQDEYAGHMFALGVLYKLVDDEEVRATVVQMLSQVGQHLMDNQLTMYDWDGRAVEHGRLYAYAMDNFPGFNAGMAMGFMKMAIVASGDEQMRDFLDNCLLQKGGTLSCLDYASESPRPYWEHLENSGLYVGTDSCKSNWNNISMHFASLHNLIWFETDPELRAIFQHHLQFEAFDPPDTARPVSEQNNTWFDFIYAAHKDLGPESDGPAYAAVENGICMLRQFPATQSIPTLECPADKCSFACMDRLDHEIGSYPRQVAERCPSTFIWWGNPYDLRGCTENRRTIKVPTDYLLAYWMGRYYGFISEDM